MDSYTPVSLKFIGTKHGENSAVYPHEVTLEVFDNNWDLSTNQELLASKPALAIYSTWAEEDGFVGIDLRPISKFAQYLWHNLDEDYISIRLSTTSGIEDAYLQCCLGSLPPKLEYQAEKCHVKGKYYYKSAIEYGCECLSGYYGDGKSSCELIQICAAGVVSNANFPLTQGGENEKGHCLNGFIVTNTMNPYIVRRCNENGHWSTTGTGDCISGCQAEATEKSFYPNTVAGENATGICNVGYMEDNEKLPTRPCVYNGKDEPGEWDEIVNDCVPIFCSSTVFDNANFPTTQAGKGAQGTCIDGHIIVNTANDFILRSCGMDGKWDGVSGKGDCVPGCIGEGTQNSVFPDTESGKYAEGECREGYETEVGGKNPVRQCINAILPYWSPSIENDCVPIYCPADSFDNAQFEEIQAGLHGRGYCLEDFILFGTEEEFITRKCDLDGNWNSEVIEGKCERGCSATQTTEAEFPDTLAGETATGKCREGYTKQGGKSPTRYCINHDYGNEPAEWDMSVENNCVPLVNPCPEDEHMNAVFPPTSGDTYGTGTCVAGYGAPAPGPARFCHANGSWDNEVDHPCEEIFCDENEMAYAQFGKTQAGQIATGTCIPGYQSGETIQAQCDLDASWSTPSGSCTPIYCDGEQMENAQFGKTQAGQTAIGTCISGYESSNTIQAECDLNGDWSSPSSSCTPIYCEGKQMENAQFGKTQAGTTGTGTCLPGYGYEYSYTIQTECDISGNWLAPLNSCSWITCPPVSYQVADFSVTNGGNNATGTCHDGYMSEGDGPVRYCLPNGKWSNDVYHPCIGYCETEDGFNATWPLAFVGMTSIGECSVDFFGAPERLCVEMAPGKYAFEDTITGTLCFEMSCPADGEWPEIGVGNRVNKKCDTYYTGVRYRDCERPDNITATEGVWSTLGTTCTIIKCAQSVTDEYFLQETNVTEEAVGKCLDGLIGTPTAKCILDKDGESASFGEISNVCRATSAEGMLALPIIVGVAAGLVALILCLFFLLVFLYRRRRKGKEEEHGDMYEMFAKKATQDSMSMSGTLNRSNGNLSTGPVDTTLINTVTEIVLPGFLKLNFATDVRQGEKIGAGGAGSLYMGVGLNPHVFPKKSNKENIAIKRFHDLEYGMKNEMAVNSFFQEVSIMWSLNSHPNVIRLLGYSESPYAIVMELHATDLRTLIHQENVLTHELAFMLATDIISAIAAMHVKGITHRDIKTSNVLIDQRDRLTAILCDFGLARVADTSITILSSKFVTVEGLSPRYTPPEVVRRFVNKNLNEPYPSIEVEKQSDIFSYGIVVWEMLTKVIPWTQNPGVAETKQIFDALLRGERPLPDIEDFANNYPSNSPLKFLSVIIKFCLAQDPDKRPTATDIFHKLKKS